jgi:hypothetical protein
LIPWLVFFLITSLLVVPIVPAQADTNPATSGLVARCDVAPASTPNTLTQFGEQAVVPGETLTVKHEVDFAAGTIYQDILKRPDNSTYFASYLETKKLPSDLVIDPASVKLKVNGVEKPLTSGTEPLASGFVLHEIPNGATGTTWRVYFPGDVAAMTTDQPGAGRPSYTVPAPG